MQRENKYHLKWRRVFRLGCEYPKNFGVLWVAEGTARVEVGPTAFTLKEGECLVLARHTVTFIYSDNVRYVFLDLPVSMPAEMDFTGLFCGVKIDADHPDYDVFAAYLNLILDNIAGLKDFSWEGLTFDPTLPYKPVLDAISKLTDWNFPMKSHTMETKRLMEDIALYLMTEDGQRHHLEDVAAKFYVSRSYLSRLFREFSGHKFSTFHNLILLSRAIHALQESPNLIADISYRLGLVNSKSLNRLFRDYLDIAPSDVRKFYEKYGGGSSSTGIPSIFRTRSTEDEREIPRTRIVVTEKEKTVPRPWRMAMVFFFLKERLKKGHWYDTLRSVPIHTLRLKIGVRDGELFYSIYDYSQIITEKQIIDLEEALCAQPSIRKLFLTFDFLADEDYTRTGRDFEAMTERHDDHLKRFFRMMFRVRGRLHMDEFMYEIYAGSLSRYIHETRVLRNFETYVTRLARTLHALNEGIKHRVGLGIGDMHTTTDGFRKSMNYFKKFRHSVDFFYFKAATSDEVYRRTGDAFEQLNQMNQLLRAQLGYIMKEVPNRITTLGIEEVRIEMDFSKIPSIYFDLFECRLIMQAEFLLGQLFENLYAYVFEDRNTGEIEYAYFMDSKNIYKPLYHVLRQMQQWKGDAVCIKNSTVIVQNGEDYYGLVMADPTISNEALAAQTLYEDVEKRRIIVEDVNGPYKLVTYRLNILHGTPAYHMEALSMPPTHGQEEVEYINTKFGPEMFGEIIEVDSVWEHEFALMPYEITMFRLTRVAEIFRS